MPISRRQFISSSVLALAAPSILRSPFGARGTLVAAQQVPTKFEDLRGGVGIFTGQGGTIGWLVTDDGAVAVDSQYVATANACVDGLKQRSPKGIQLLINTHHHADHVMGNSAFRPVVGKIVQQERCAKYHKDTTAKDGTAPQQAYADTVFGASWSAAIGGEKVSCKYYGPGHTGGDVIVVFEKANVVHMGDLMFYKRHPFIDRPNGGSVLNWTKSLTKIADEHKDAMFIFGHAKVGLPVTGTRADLVSFRDYFLAVTERVQEGIRANEPLESITKQNPLPGFEDYAGNPPRLSLASSLTAVYEELTGKVAK